MDILCSDKTGTLTLNKLSVDHTGLFPMGGEPSLSVPIQRWVPGGNVSTLRLWGRDTGLLSSYGSQCRVKGFHRHDRNAICSAWMRTVH